MALKTATVTITDEGRDQGKMFLLTEMPARKAEKWGLRALIVLENSGIQVPDHVKGTGMAGISAFAASQVIGSGLNFDAMEPLLDEMLGCVQIIRDKNHPTMAFPLMESEPEEVSTLLRLRAEVLLLHVGFFPAAVRSKLSSMLMAAISSTIPTSQESSAS